MLPLLYICCLGVRHRVKRVTYEEPEEILFTEITADAGHPAAVTRDARGSRPMGAEALLASRYAAFLLLARGGLDLLARHSHRRSESLPHGGLRVPARPRPLGMPGGRATCTGWTPITAERLARYRASPAVCNACPAKGECTDSDAGPGDHPRARSRGRTPRRAASIAASASCWSCSPP